MATKKGTGASKTKRTSGRPSGRVARAAGGARAATTGTSPPPREGAPPAPARTHVSLAWFPGPAVFSPRADAFGYLTPPTIRGATKLPFNATSQALLAKLGSLMGDRTRGDGDAVRASADAGYVGPLVDHDLDLAPRASAGSSAEPEARAPSLDLDRLYGRGPALDPFLYRFPTAGPRSAIKTALGTRTALAAVLGDARDDQRLLVSQLHQAMPRFHDAVVDMLVSVGFGGDIFAEARRIVTHHYQWAVLTDLLPRICGAAAVERALGEVTVAVNSAFKMPVELAVAAYGFGHGLVRSRAGRDAVQDAAPMKDVFGFVRAPDLTVLSSWVVDLNTFFGAPVPVNTKVRRGGGEVEMMVVLATRNLQRSLALGLPSGQGVAQHLGVSALTAEELRRGLPADEVAVLEEQGQLLMKKTPLWYYVLREAAVLHQGERLGPVGAEIVADTFVRMLKRDGGSCLNASGFAPVLRARQRGTFGFADLVAYAGVDRASGAERGADGARP